MLAQSDIILEIYTENIAYMRDYLKLSVSDNSFFYQVENSNPLVYKGLSYDTSSARNLALYIIALKYSSDDVPNQQVRSLYDMVESIKQSVSSDDYTSKFYIDLSCSLLNVPGIAKNDKVTSDTSNKESVFTLSQYYYYKANDLKTQNIQDSSDILTKLASLDISNDSSGSKQVLKNIDIFSYKNQDDFYVILNLYVDLMLDNNLLTADLKDNIKSYIDQYKSIYGYNSKNGNYSFEESVYYTNILNMMNGGHSNALR